MKKIMIAGATSGSGKTSVTLGILAALSDSLQIQPYKIGPDYVDTKFHSRITGRQSRNIDSFLVPDVSTLKYLFERDTDSVDLGLVEGVMGLYDGLGTDKDAHSSSSIAKALDIPVVLVVNGRSASTSIAAIVKGFLEFDPAVPIVGVVVNNVMSQNHFELIKGAIERYVDVTVLGYLPFNKELSLPSRQLGLVPDNELPTVDSKIAELGKLAKAHIDLHQLLTLAGTSVDAHLPSPIVTQQVDLTLGIAKDDAFNFYYQDNLAALREAGVTLKVFSPIADKKLPEEIDALYLGGGYPEEFAAALSANTAMKQAVRDFSLAGRSIYAECGGLMYLGNRLTTDSGTFDMVGLLDGDSKMTPRLKRFGYCDATPVVDTIIGAAGTQLVGHEFHHSVFTANAGLEPVLRMQKIRDGVVADEWTGGYQVRQTFASYLHVHFYQSKAVFNGLLDRLGARAHASH